MANEGKASRPSIGLFESAIGPLLREAYNLWAPVPAEHTELLRRLDQSSDETDGYKFKIGQTVHFLPTRNLYVVTAVLPERDSEREYCINNETEPYQRLAKESELSLSL